MYGMVVRLLGVSVVALVLASCSKPAAPVTHAASPGQPTPAPAGKREIRLTGVMEAVHSSKVTVPQIAGQGGPMITKLIANGATVKEGDLIAVFDSTQQVDARADGAGQV
jgi:multidrug efflux pump subunit AcrA (membrane-fusion protein)